MNYLIPSNASELRLHIQNKREVPRKKYWDVYLPLEALLEDHGFNGRECLLRSMCEAAQASFHHEEAGLLEEIAHAVFT